MTTARQPPDDLTDAERAADPGFAAEFRKARQRLETFALSIERIAVALARNNNRLRVLKTRLALARWRADRDADRLAGELAALTRAQEELQAEVAKPGRSQDAELDATIKDLRDRGQLPDEQVIHTALVELDILDEDAPLPVPYRTRTGKAGRSRVHYLHVTNKHGTETALVAKFDEPERAEREWAVVRELHREPQVTYNAIMPIPGNTAEHAVILYRIAPDAVELEEYLLNQFLGNKDNCVDALARSIKALEPFHRAGTHDDMDPTRSRELVWGDFYPWLLDRKLDRRAAMLETARRHCPADWPRDPTFTAPGLPDLALPNPFIEAPPARAEPPLPRFERMLAEPTGKVRLSRIHGDLNLTNILLSRTEDGKPDEVAIIDLAFSAKRWLTASDFAFLETHLWLDVFSVLADQARWEPAKAGGCLAAVRDELEGRPAAAADGTIARRCARLVELIRAQAAGLLRRGAGYLLKDYFHCLFFANMNALGYRTVREDPMRGRVVETMAEDPLKAQIILLNAALALRVLDDQKEGKYVGKMKGGKLPKLKKPR